MNLGDLMQRLPPKKLGQPRFPRHLLGAFRRKSISFCTGLTDESTVVYWFQSQSFTIDLRLPDAKATPATERQGWIGDTLWNDATAEMSWHIRSSYQARNQWPEPARLHFIGNAVLEFAPSGAYFEDWRQQSSRGPLMGLRLVSIMDQSTQCECTMDGGIIIAGKNIAYACSRQPSAQAALSGINSLEEHLTAGKATVGDLESYEVSVALDGWAVSHSTRPAQVGETICSGDFEIRSGNSVIQHRDIGGTPYTLLYQIDVFEPDFEFTNTTPTTLEAKKWMEQEKNHIFLHATTVK